MVGTKSQSDAEHPQANKRVFSESISAMTESVTLRLG